MAEDSGAAIEPSAFSLDDLLRLSTPENLVARLTPAREVYAAQGIRWLCSPPGAVQSAIRSDAASLPVLLNHRCMALAAVLPARTQHVLDLGAGCGAMLAFARDLPGLVTVTGLEADAGMLRTAREYFSLPPEQPVVVEDAMSFLARGGGIFDLVFCDVFEGVTEPPWLDDAAFYQRLSLRVADDGAAAINMLPQTGDRLRNRLEYVRAHFPGIGVLAVPAQSNVVVLLSKRSLPDVGSWRELLCDRGLDRRGIATDLIDAVRVI